MGLRDKYEAHHNVKISNEAVKASVELSSRYINDRFLPDKAIDLMDEAASRLKMQTYMEPESLKKIADEILEYLRGKAKVGTIVNYINKDNIKRCGKVGNKITITYKSTDDGLVISKIK
jgi:ATP-dependent Clp protease ATP-binding subunit ClpC